MILNILPTIDSQPSAGVKFEQTANEVLELGRNIRVLPVSIGLSVQADCLEASASNLLDREWGLEHTELVEINSQSPDIDLLPIALLEYHFRGIVKLGPFVKTSVPDTVLLAIPYKDFLASPKSVSLAYPFSKSSTFSGFKSRYM